MRKKITVPILTIDQKKTDFNEFRCKNCNKLLGLQNIHDPSLDIKCIRCGQLNSILHNAEKQIIVTDKNGFILYVNEQVEKVSGYTRKEMVGKTPALWGKQMTKQFYKDIWNQISSQKKAIAVQITNKNKNGKRYTVVLSISPILNLDGEIECFLGIETTQSKNLKSSKQ